MILVIEKNINMIIKNNIIQYDNIDCSISFTLKSQRVI